MIADIRARCFEIRERGKPTTVAMPDREASKAIGKEWTGKYAEAAAYRDQWAKRRGFKDFEEALGKGACGQKRK